MRKYYLLILLLVCILPDKISGNIRVPKIFSDNMVLQRQMSIPIWGWGEPGETVEAQIAGYSGQAITSSDGKWKLFLGPLDAGGPYELTLRGSDTIVIHNVLVGEIWVCSGQSNMAMEVENCMNSAEVKASSDFPFIRQFQVKRTKSKIPLDDISGSENSADWLNTWENCSDSTVGHFSGVAYFFALNLHKKLGIPIGLIHASWGGTTAEAWTPYDTLYKDNFLKHILNHWPAYNNDEDWLREEYEKYVKDTLIASIEGKQIPLYFNQPSVLYNGIIAPVTPFGIRGVIWYQGESNAYRAFQYQRLFPALIEKWRRSWNQGDFPFLFVQLAGYHFEPQVFPELREAQSMALSIKNTAMAVTIDIGDSTDIHPGNKQDVGYRLSLAALKLSYGEDICYSGPTFRSMYIRGNRCRLQFDNICEGLISKGSGRLSGFTISGEDKQFFEASSIIEGNEVVIWNDSIANPKAVRYAWQNYPGKCNLYNISGSGVTLPASPFRTDDWPGHTQNNY